MVKIVHYLIRDEGYEYAYETETSCYLATGNSKYSTNKNAVTCKVCLKHFVSRGESNSD